jgi:cell division protein FtsQ
MGWFGGGKKRGASPQRRSRAELAPAGVAPRQWTERRTPIAHKPRAERKPLPWRQWGRRALPAVAVALVLGLLLAGWKMLDYVGSVPVSRVMVTGNLRHLDRNLLVARVEPLLAGAGFMTVDLESIRTALQALPWVEQVSIQRRWPDQLVIAVSEQEAIARWGGDGLLNRRGEVFRPQPLGDVATLPKLFGPDNLAAEVVGRYAELRALLGEQNLSLLSLGIDERGSWAATLQNGIVLRLGTGDTLKKIRRFLHIYRADLSRQLDRIDYIDLRYSNGLAVGWKQNNLERG